VATSIRSFTRSVDEFRFADIDWRPLARMDWSTRWFSHWRGRQSGRAPAWHVPDQLGLSHDRASTVFHPMQRARLVPLGFVHRWRGLSQLSSRISTRLPERGPTMAMGSDQVVDLEFVKTRPNQRSAASAKRNDSFADEPENPEPTRSGTFLSFTDFL